jgi:hypothetical protein
LFCKQLYFATCTIKPTIRYWQREVNLEKNYKKMIYLYFASSFLWPAEFLNRPSSWFLCCCAAQQLFGSSPPRQARRSGLDWIKSNLKYSSDNNLYFMYNTFMCFYFMYNNSFVCKNFYFYNYRILSRRTKHKFH